MSVVKENQADLTREKTSEREHDVFGTWRVLSPTRAIHSTYAVAGAVLKLLLEHR